MRYASLGRIPAKRHVQFRDPDPRSNGTAPLLVEEVMGFEGFSGNESILYHLWSPCRVKDVGEFEPIELEEWVPDTHVHRLTNTRGARADGRPVLGRRVLQYNADVEIGDLRPRGEADYFYRDGEGDEVIFVHEGAGVVETIFGSLPYRKHDYVVIPRGTTYRFRFDEPAALADLLHAGRDRDAEPLPQPLRPAARARAVLAARLPPAGRARDPPRPRRARRQGARARRLPGLRARLPPARRRRLGRLRLPVHVQHRRLRAQGRPPAPAAARAPDVPGPELRDLLVLPAHARLGPEGDRRCPYHHSNVQSRGGHVLRRRRLRRAQGRRHRLRSRCTRPACRTARSRAWWRSRSASTRDRGARGDVRHVPAAEADDALARPRRPQLRATPGTRRARSSRRRVDATQLIPQRDALRRSALR